MPELHKERDLGTGREGEESRHGNPIQEDHQDKWRQTSFFNFYLFVPGLSCSMWDLVFWPGIKPRPPAVGARSLSCSTTREVPKIFKKIFKISLSFDSHLLKFSHICINVYTYTFLFIYLFIKKSSQLVNSYLLVLIDCSSQILSWINQIQERIWSNWSDQIKSIKSSLQLLR